MLISTQIFARKVMSLLQATGWLTLKPQNEVETTRLRKWEKWMGLIFATAARHEKLPLMKGAGSQCRYQPSGSAEDDWLLRIKEKRDNTDLDRNEYALLFTNVKFLTLGEVRRGSMWVRTRQRTRKWTRRWLRLRLCWSFDLDIWWERF